VRLFKNHLTNFSLTINSQTKQHAQNEQQHIMIRAISKTVTKSNRGLISRGIASKATSSPSHSMKKEDFDSLPDKNSETDVDRWSDPNNPTPEQERKLTQESRGQSRYNTGTPESNVDLNAEWKGFSKQENDTDLDKKGVQNRD
jgi:hypothetical protein